MIDVRTQTGFTIIELLVTLVIVGILASAAVPMAELSVQRSKEQDLRHALREVRDAIDAYKKAGDEGHMIRKLGESGYPHSLKDLVKGVVDVKGPQGSHMYFLRRVPRDPFADSSMLAEDTWGKRSYASSAEEPKEGDDIYDVYSLAPGAGLTGQPYREW